MTIENIPNGGYLITDIKNGYLIKQRYYFYSLTQAKRLFKTYYKNA
jgi:hypothetical protein